MESNISSTPALGLDENIGGIDTIKDARTSMNSLSSFAVCFFFLRLTMTGVEGSSLARCLTFLDFFFDTWSVGDGASFRFLADERVEAIWVGDWNSSHYKFFDWPLFRNIHPFLPHPPRSTTKPTISYGKFTSNFNSTWNGYLMANATF